MDVIADIFDALGEATAIAAALKEPVQTVHSWKTNGNIPRWRRAPLLELRPVEGKDLTAEAVAYLRSTDRHPMRPSSEQVAA